MRTTKLMTFYRFMALLPLVAGAMPGLLAMSGHPSDKADTTATENNVTVNAGPTVRTLNVMKGVTPHLPTFPKLTPKPGFVRGYVLDANGKPLAGARIGVRATGVGGFYSGAMGKTDEQGYYEIKVPWGAAHFYTAGYSVDYGDGRAALGLYPVDGEADQFASPNGHVENWVLLPYGIADRDGAQDNPNYCNNYFGGSVVLSYHVNTDSVLSNTSELPANTEIELTLTPDGPMIDGSKGKTITIKKNVGTLFFGQLYINNIPVGSYHLTAKAGGKALKVKEVGPYANQEFGLDPKESTGSMHLLFRPSTAKADMTIAAHGNWQTVDITVQQP